MLALVISIVSFYCEWKYIESLTFLSFYLTNQYQPSLQHFRPTATLKHRCLMQKNRCHRLQERFSGRTVLRRTLSHSQRFLSQNATAPVKP
jgi:hypothetical protein